MDEAVLNPLSRRLLTGDDLEILPAIADVVLSALTCAQEHLLSAHERAAGSADAVDAAVQQVRQAVRELNRIEQRLDALLWQVESAEMDAELARNGYREETPGWWTSPCGGPVLTQSQALSRLDEEMCRAS